MIQITQPQKGYLQKNSSLPTGLPKNLKIQRPHEPQTTTSTPTGRKITSFSSQSHFFSAQKPVPRLSSALSTQTKQQVDHSFHSISSRVQNQEQKKNMMKKQSIYLYIRKYLNADEANITNMNFKNRYAMYKPEPVSEKRNFAETARGYLPRVNGRQTMSGNIENGRNERYWINGEDLDRTVAKANKNPKLVSSGQNVQTSKQSKISSRRRVNQMLKRDKQLSNLHRNGHQAHSHSSSQQHKQKNKGQKSNSKDKVQSIISERFQTLDEAQKEKIEREKMERLKQEIKQEIMEKIAEKEQENKQENISEVKQMSLTEQLSMLENRENELSAFMQKVEEQHNFRSLTQLREIIDNSRPIQVRKQLVDREVSCRIVDVQEVTAKEKERLERQLEIQALRTQLEQVLGEKQELEKTGEQQSKRVEGQKDIEKQLRLRLEHLRKELEQQVKEKVSLMEEKDSLRRQQLQNQQKRKKLEENLEKQQNKYQSHSLNSAIDMLTQMNCKAENIEESINQTKIQSEKISAARQSISLAQEKHHQITAQHRQTQLHEQQTAVKEKITQINHHLKVEHEKYLELMEVRKSEADQRKESLNLSHLSLRQKVADMELLKDELKKLKQELELIAVRQRETHEQHEQEIRALKQANRAGDNRKPSLKQKKYNKQLVQSQAIMQSESLLKLANECQWGLFPIEQTREQQTITFANHLKQDQRQTRSQETSHGSLPHRSLRLKDNTSEQRQDQLLQMMKDREGENLSSGQQSKQGMGGWQLEENSQLQDGDKRAKHGRARRMISRRNEYQQQQSQSRSHSSHQEVSIMKPTKPNKIANENNYNDWLEQEQEEDHDDDQSQLQLHYLENNHPLQGSSQSYDDGDSQFDVYGE